MYICQLSQEQQDDILNKCRKVFENLAYEVDTDEELENVLNSKFSDIKHVIYEYNLEI